MWYPKGLKLLGQIPEVKGPVTSIDPSSKSFDIISKVAGGIWELSTSTGVRSVVFPSYHQQEGRSTLISLIGVALGYMGKRVVLVDTNLRRPSLHRLFGIDVGEGIISFLERRGVTISAGITIDRTSPPDLEIGDLRALTASGQLEPPALQPLRPPVPKKPGVEEAKALLSILYKTSFKNLSIVPAERALLKTGELLRGHRIANVFITLEAVSDLVLVDPDALSSSADPLSIASKTDACILVISQVSKKQDVRTLKDALDTVGANILGVIINLFT
jgi:Mrp family chromosome partitioning ATPase